MKIFPLFILFIVTGVYANAQSKMDTACRYSIQGDDYAILDSTIQHKGCLIWINLRKGPGECMVTDTEYICGFSYRWPQDYRKQLKKRKTSK